MPNYNTAIVHAGNGVQKDFSIPFAYTSTAEVEVYVNNVLNTGYTFPSNGVIRFSVAPASGVVILIRRNTSVAEPRTVFEMVSSLALGEQFMCKLKSRCRTKALQQVVPGLQVCRLH